MPIEQIEAMKYSNGNEKLEGPVRKRERVRFQNGKSKGIFSKFLHVAHERCE